ncbi:hypothetical protein ACH5RR_028682 [Cinchona calisaya]|uniref:Uncharacterized protein n=1 Tax=Cinchona calisaya TaxID=153742 RepID=A0ABD2YQW5_9GENT
MYPRQNDGINLLPVGVCGIGSDNTVRINNEKIVLEIDKNEKEGKAVVMRREEEESEVNEDDEEIMAAIKDTKSETPSQVGGTFPTQEATGNIASNGVLIKESSAKPPDSGH